MNTDDPRGPPPSVSLPVLLLVPMTFVVLLGTASLALRPGHDALRFIFMTLNLALIPCGGWLLWRSRHDGQLSTPLLYALVLIVPMLVPVVARLTLDLADGRRPSPFDGGALVLSLVTLLIAVFWNRRKP